MEATLDRFGRIVIPKPARVALGLDVGTVLEIEHREDALLLRPRRPEPDLVRDGGVLVYNGEAEGDLERALEISRDERARHLTAGTE